MKYQRRSDDERVAALEAQIAGIRERAVRRAAKADPVQQHARAALRAIEKALDTGATDTLQATLVTAAGAIRMALGVSPPLPVQEPPKPRRRTRIAQAT